LIYKNNKIQKGFTLIEVILVVVIVVIIGSIGTTMLNNMMNQQRQTATRIEAQIVVEAVNSFNILLPPTHNRRIDTVAGLHFDNYGRIDLNTTHIDGALIAQDLSVTITPRSVPEIIHWIGIENDPFDGISFLVLLDTPVN